MSAVSEFYQADPDVNQILQSSGMLLEFMLERVVSDGQHKGEIRASLPLRVVAEFLASTLLGLKLSVKGDANTSIQGGIAVTIKGAQVNIN